MNKNDQELSKNQQSLNLAKKYNESDLPFVRINSRNNTIIFANKAATPLLRSLGCLVNTTFPVHLLPVDPENNNTILIGNTELETEAGTYSLAITAFDDKEYIDIDCFGLSEGTEKGSLSWHGISHHEAIL